MVENPEPPEGGFQPSTELQLTPSNHNQPGPKRVRNEPRAARRTKVTTACLPCRIRKVKCDGQRPICSRCAGNVASDGYPASCAWDGADGRSSGPSTVSRGARRAKRPYYNLVDTENGRDGAHNFVSHQSLLSRPNADSPDSYQVDYLSPPIDDSETLPSSHGARNLWGGAHDEPSWRQHSGFHEPIWYGQVGRTIHYELRRCGRHYALGTASVAPLASNIESSVTGHASPEERPTHPFHTLALNRHNSLIFQPSQQPNEVDYELPRRGKADVLFSTYWEHFHPVFPTLDAAETKDAYDKLWTAESSTASNRTFLSIINVIFAVASRVDTSMDPASREEASARYCGRALELFNGARMRCVSFPSIQAALLIAEYLHSLHPEQCWMYTGIAIRMAQSLGLHRPRMISSSIRNARALLLCQRVWKLCVVWDRILCMTYGRSMMVSQREASSLSPFHATSTVAGDLPESWAENMASSFLDKSLELYIVVGRALDDFSCWDLEAPDQESHTPTSRVPPGYSAVDQVLKHERSLSELQRSLPAQFSIPTVFETNTDLLQQRHAVILHQRFSQARTVLLRPLLSYLVGLRRQPRDRTASKSSDNLPHSIFIQCSIACVAAARETIHTLNAYNRCPASDGEPRAQSLTNAWWNNVLYLYSAVTVLIAARFCSEVVAGVGEAEMDQSWSLALQLFRQHEEHGHWVRQLSQILQRLARTARLALGPPAAEAAMMHLDSGRDQSSNQGSVAPQVGNNVESTLDSSLLVPMLDPMAMIEGGVPFFHHGTDLDAILYSRNDSFAALDDGELGG